MAKHGIQGMVGGGSAEGGAMHKVVLGLAGGARASIGKQIELGERLCFGFHFYMADSREQGMREAAKYYEENMKMFGELRLVRALTEEQIEIMRDPKRAPTAKLPRIEDAVKAGGFLSGSPAEIIEHLKALEEKYPALDRVSVSLSVGVPKSEALEQLERFADGGDAGVQGGQDARAGLGWVRLRYTHPIDPGRGPAIERRLLARRRSGGHVLEGVPQLGVAAGLLVGREIALEHAAVDAECLDAGLDIGAPRRRQLLRRRRERRVRGSRSRD